MKEQPSKALPLVLIADASDGLRQWLKAHLAKTFPGCRFADAVSEADVRGVCSTLLPDIVLLDVSLAGRGLEVASLVKQTIPTADVVLLSTHDQSVVRKAAEHVAVSGIVVKTRIHEELVPLLAKLLNMAPKPNTPSSSGTPTLGG